MNKMKQIGAGLLAAAALFGSGWIGGSQNASARMIVAAQGAGESTGWSMVCDGMVICQPFTPAPSATPSRTPTATEQTFPNALTVSPTPIVQVPSATATRTPTATLTQVTPALATHTPAFTPTLNIGACDWIGIGAAWYQPRGNAFYEYTDPAGTHIQEQNIRSGPGTAYPIVGKLPLGQAREVWHYINFVDQQWVSLDETCDQWVAVWLGFIDVK